MVKTYLCECCSFQTQKKSTYDNHLTSTKHKNKFNGVTSSSSTTSSTISEEESINTSTASRIRELEHQILIMKTEYELKLQNKDEIIAMLKEQLNNKPSTTNSNIQLKVEENSVRPKSKINIVYQEPDEIVVNQPTKKLSTIEMLNKTRANAPSIEELFDEFLIKNKLSITSQFNGITVVTPKQITHRDYPDNFISYYVNQICNRINELPQNEKPIYCSDQRRHSFIIKTKGSWIKETGDVDKILMDIINRYKNTLINLFRSLNTLLPKSPYCTSDSLKEEIENENPKAIQYIKDKQKYDYWFKETYGIYYEKYFENAKNISVKTNMCLVENDKALDKLKISLSSITGDKVAVYKDVHIPNEISDSESDEDYDCEKDPDYI